jgi:hypothetical protein
MVQGQTGAARVQTGKQGFLEISLQSLRLELYGPVCLISGGKKNPKKNNKQCDPEQERVIHCMVTAHGELVRSHFIYFFYKIHGINFLTRSFFT